VVLHENAAMLQMCRVLGFTLAADPQDPGLMQVVRSSDANRPGIGRRRRDEGSAPVEEVVVRALLLGGRLDTRALERDRRLGTGPLTIEAPGDRRDLRPHRTARGHCAKKGAPEPPARSYCAISAMFC